MQEFDVERRGGTYSPDEVVDKYRRYGLVVLKQFMPRDCKASVREILNARLEEAKRSGNVLHLEQYPAADFLLGDVLAVRELARYDYLFFGDEITKLVKRILGSEEIVYFGDSSVQFDAAARGFHKDNVERLDAKTGDWVDDYGLLRCAFYCQDHVQHSGGLKVRLGSHTLNATRSLLRDGRISHQRGKAVDVETECGDLVVWSMRLTHSGNAIRLRGPLSVCLHPRVEMVLPRALGRREEYRRIAAFCAFGRPGKHLETYISNMVARDADYRAYLERARNPSDAMAFLAARNVTFRCPCPYYGTRDFAA